MENNLILPQIAVGEHYTTRLVLLNVVDLDQVGSTWEDLFVTGKILFFRPNGKPFPLKVNGEAATAQYEFSLFYSSSTVLDLSADCPDTSGWAMILVDDQSQESPGQMVSNTRPVRGERLLVTSFFTYQAGGQTISRVAVFPSLYQSAMFRLTTLSVQHEADIQTGIAIVNTSSRAVPVDLRLRDASGQFVASRTMLLLAGNQRAQYLHELFGSTMPGRFQGSLQIQTGEEGVVSMGLLLGRGIMTAVPSHRRVLSTR